MNFNTISIRQYLNKAFDTRRKINNGLQDLEKINSGIFLEIKLQAENSHGGSSGEKFSTLKLGNIFIRYLVTATGFEPSTT